MANKNTIADTRLQITVPVGAGNTLYTRCEDCALHFVCPNGKWCNKFDFSRATVKVMRKKKDKHKGTPLEGWTEEDFLEVQDMVYNVRMRQECSPVPHKDGTYVKLPTTMELVKAHCRLEEIRKAKAAALRSKEDIKEEIHRLQGVLADLEKEDEINTPHKQLNLFDDGQGTT